MDRGDSVSTDGCPRDYSRSTLKREVDPAGGPQAQVTQDDQQICKEEAGTLEEGKEINKWPAHCDLATNYGEALLRDALLFYF